MMSKGEDKKYLSKLNETENRDESRHSLSSSFDGSKLNSSKGGNVDYENQHTFMQLIKKASIESLKGINTCNPKNTTDVPQHYENQSEGFHSDHTVPIVSDTLAVQLRSQPSEYAGPLCWDAQKLLNGELLESSWQQEYFSRLEKEHILLPDSSSRHMSVEDAPGYYDPDKRGALIFSRLRGEIAIAKSKHIPFDSKSAEKLKNYYTTVHMHNSKENSTDIISISETYGLCISSTDLRQGIFDVQSVDKGTGGLHISEFIGEHMQYFLSKVEDKTIIPSDFHADKFSQIAYSTVGEVETKKTLYLLLSSKKSPFKAYENDDEFLPLLGTTLGSGVLNTLEQYKHILGDKKIRPVKL